MPQHIRWVYDTDPTNLGFFCPQLEQKRRDYFAIKQLRPAEAESVYQCHPGARVGSIFVESDFRYYEAPIALHMGRNHPIVAKWIEEKNGIIAQGWDTAMSASSQADYSACVTVLFVPCEEFHREHEAELLGECDQHLDAYVLEVYRQKHDIGDLVLAMREQALKWTPERIIVEKKASGASAMQALANSGLPLEGVSPQENKRERAINGGAGAGSVQGWFKSGRVLFPALPGGLPIEWLAPFIRELKDFSGEKGATDDQVDGLVHVISWGIREGSVSVRFPADWQSVEQVDQHMRAPTGMAAVFGGLVGDSLEQLLEQGIVIDPFENTCGRCRNFRSKERPSCKVHKRMVSAIHSACESFDNGTQVVTFPRF